MYGAALREADLGWMMSEREFDFACDGLIIGMYNSYYYF